MQKLKNATFLDYIYNLNVPFSAEKYNRVKQELENLLVSPLKIIAFLVTISGIFSMVFEVRYFSTHSFEVYLIRLIETFVSFALLAYAFAEGNKKHRVILIHILLLTIVAASSMMIYIIPSTLLFNSQIAGLVIFTSALFLSWEVKNQILVSIYYNVVFASAVVFNNQGIYFMPNMIESVLFVIFLSLLSIIASAVNFKMRMDLAEKSMIIEQSEKKYRTIFDNLAEGVFQSLPEGRFVTANQALLDILGYDSVDELKEADLVTEIYTNGEDRQKLLREIEEKGEVRNYSLSLRKKDGTGIIVALSDRPVYDEDGNILFYEGTMNDVTKEVYLEEERRKAEEALKEEKIKSDRLAREALAASEAKSQFLANMSHEIRTPMNGVLGYLELMEQEVYDDKEELNSFIGKAKSAAESLLDIINNILDISKIEAGRMHLDEVDFSLREVLEHAASIVETLASEKHLSLHYDIAPEVPLLLKGDPVRLRQIFANLMSNAIKFTPKGGVSVSVELKEAGPNDALILAKVKDTGIGIPKEKMDLLFKPFSQVDNSYTRSYKGTGLGLRICKEFVAMMGGEINVESRQGQGSCFYFTARFKKKEMNIQPEKSPVPAVQPQINEDELKSHRSSFHLLLVDDNPINRSVEQKIIEEAGYRIATACSASEALEAAESRNYDLVIMDIQLPEMDGITASGKMRQINAHYSNVPIIAITALGLKDEEQKYRAAGLNGLVLKPISAKSFISEIDERLIR